jgi:hypothetical protein
MFSACRESQTGELVAKRLVLVPCGVPASNDTEDILNRGELDGMRLLKPETVDLMFQNHLQPEIG